MVFHFLGKQEEELRIAEDRRRRFPESRGAMLQEMVAHIALGNVEKALQLKKDMYVSLKGPNVGYGLTYTAMEFQRHGYREEAREVIEEAVQWFDERPESERTAYRVDQFDALYTSVIVK